MPVERKIAANPILSLDRAQTRSIIFKIKLKLSSKFYLYLYNPIFYVLTQPKKIILLPKIDFKFISYLIYGDFYHQLKYLIRKNREQVKKLY